MMSDLINFIQAMSFFSKLNMIECSGHVAKALERIKVLSEIRNMKEKDHFEWNNNIKIDLGKTNYIGVG
jgi:hypothetical protein